MLKKTEDSKKIPVVPEKRKTNVLTSVLPLYHSKNENYVIDYYCPTCGSLAAYMAVGVRRIERGGVQTSCRVCGQVLDWKE